MRNLLHSTGPSSHILTGHDSAQSYRLFLSPRKTWISNDANRLHVKLKPTTSALWVTFNYCKLFGAVLKYSSLDDSILISIWNYPIISSGSFFFFLHSPNFPQTGLAEQRGVQWRSSSCCWSQMSISNFISLDEGVSFSQTDINRQLGFTLMAGGGDHSNATLHSGDNRVFTEKVSRWLFQSKRDFCGQRLMGGCQQPSGNTRAGSEAALSCMCAVWRTVFPVDFLFCLCRHSLLRCVACSWL